MVRQARLMFDGQVRALVLDEALFPASAWRSGLGVLKHLGAWLHVYHSFAFDAEPRHCAETSWPRGLREEVALSRDYLDEVTAWIRLGFQAWDDSLATLPAASFGESRPVHRGGTMPLSNIVILAMQHAAFHLGEFNMLLSIRRGEAWEWGEEVEENHIGTFGHRVRPDWMSEETARTVEDGLRLSHEARNARLRGG